VLTNFKALIVAHERARFSDLLSHVYGIAFFATPHRGSRLADWTNVVARIVKFASLGTSSNPALLKSLEERSPDLWEISKSFVDRSGLAILSFYELEKLPYASFKVQAMTYIHYTQS
jgi:hypothetical protein